MDDMQTEYREQLRAILASSSSNQVKKMLLQNLKNVVRDLEDLSRDPDYSKCRGNYQVLSTSISEWANMSFQTERDVEELEQKIIKMRLIKFENNEEVETMEEELFEMEKVVKARIEYNQFLKKKIDGSMEEIQRANDEKQSREKSRSVLNKSLDTVAGLLKMSKWWG